MKKAVSRVIRMSIGVTSALLVTMSVQGSAMASAQDTYSAKYGANSAVVWIASETIYVNDRENDGHDVVGQVRWWDSNKAQIRIHNVWDRSADGDEVTGNSPGPVRGIRVCEDTGSCSAWDS